MRISPIRFVQDVEKSRAFFAALGLIERTDATSGTWSELSASGGSLGLHIARKADAPDHPQSVRTRVSLQFTTDERLEALVERLRSSGYAPSAIVDETFGRYFTVADPDGYLVQINEADEELQNLSYEIRGDLGSP